MYCIGSKNYQIVTFGTFLNLIRPVHPTTSHLKTNYNPRIDLRSDLEHWDDDIKNKLEKLDVVI